MITLLELQKQVNELTREAKSISEKHGFHNSQSMKRAYVKVSNKIEFLGKIRLYLESSPSEEYLFKEQRRIKNRLQLLNDAFGGNKHSSNSFWKEYQKINDYTTLKRHLKNVNFILSSQPELSLTA